MRVGGCSREHARKYARLGSCVGVSRGGGGGCSGSCECVASNVIGTGDNALFLFLARPGILRLIYVASSSRSLRHSQHQDQTVTGCCYSCGKFEYSMPTSSRRLLRPETLESLQPVVSVLTPRAETCEFKTYRELKYFTSRPTAFHPFDAYICGLKCHSSPSESCPGMP